MSEKTLNEAAARSAKNARARRRRLFLFGAAAGMLLSVFVILARMMWPEPPPSPWVGLGDSQPQPFDLVLVARADGEWTVAYLNDSYEFITPCDGLRVRGVVRWMQAPERP